ncbi:cell division protein FtsB [Ideonella sp. BN130291]|uniref:cell division protein FtsB n=1 Tax=Ideonella sp. BN130291 TaxID=3112940 RepID=UPI002E25D53C|nr:cell division protein FtsB [Ideonella sp. BN130291]
MRLVTLLLLALLGFVHAELWFGKGSLPRVVALSGQVTEQKAKNELARQRNEQLAAEVNDLKEGLEMVEERARAELGMIRPDEILVQVTARR